MDRPTCLQPGDLDPPRVFVSSTFQDLLVEIRDVLCSELEDMSIRPVMSELPTFPYTFGQDAVDGDAVAGVPSAQLYLLVIGRRYGTSDAHERLSITEKEYRAARELGLPMLVYVHRRVWDGYLAHVAGAISDTGSTHWVDEQRVFTFIDRVAQQDRQRCVPFTHSREIVADLKAQMANLMGAYLRFERRAARWLWTEWQTAEIEQVARRVWVLTPNFFWDYADHDYRQLVFENITTRGSRYRYLYPDTHENALRVAEMKRDLDAAIGPSWPARAKYASIPSDEFNWCTEQALFNPGHPTQERGVFVDIMDGHGKAYKHNIELGREKRRAFREQFVRLWDRYSDGEIWSDG